MDKDNFFFPKSSLGSGFATRKFVKYEPYPNSGQNSYKPYNKMEDINYLIKLNKKLKLLVLKMILKQLHQMVIHCLRNNLIQMLNQKQKHNTF